MKMSHDCHLIVFYFTGCERPDTAKNSMELSLA